MKLSRKQLRKLILQEMSHRRGPLSQTPPAANRGDGRVHSKNSILSRGFSLGAQPLVDPQVEAAADYLEDGIRSSIEFADHPDEADPEYQINRTLEAMKYEINFTDIMFPGVDLDEVKTELMRRLV